MSRYVVYWEVCQPMHAEVEASSREDAIQKAMAGKLIENTIDTEPGKNLWGKAYAIPAKGESCPTCGREGTRVAYHGAGMRCTACQTIS